MKQIIKSIWIESEEKGHVIGGQFEIDDNSDVIVTLEDNSRYVASFFTYANIESLRRKNSQTGECLSGKYFWASDMVIVDKIERQGITRLVEHLIQEQTFAQIFKRIEIEVSTKYLTKEEYRNSLIDILRFIKEDGRSHIKILFGVGWGNEYKDWTPFEVAVDNVHYEIRLAEDLKVGQFGSDDFYIIINDIQTEILFCHEMDIHLKYLEPNVIVQKILKLWDSNNLMQTQNSNC